MVGSAIFVLLVSLLAQTPEANPGSVRTHHGATKFPSSITYTESELFLEGDTDVAPPKPAALSPVRTDVAGLACDFEAAIQAFNQDDRDIHVGRLLSACERLEGTMRRIGFNQGAKDIGGNIRKIRQLYSMAPPSQRDSMPDLLRYEMEMGVHDDSNGVRRIKDPSAAMGFLWLGRTLNYQNDMFRLMIDENEEPYHAARRAYDQDLKPHHSWAVQKICKAAMTTLKPMKKISVLSSLGGFEEDAYGQQENEATHRDLHQMMDSWKPLLNRWKKVFSDLELESI